MPVQGRGFTFKPITTHVPAAAPQFHLFSVIGVLRANIAQVSGVANANVASVSGVPNP